MPRRFHNWRIGTINIRTGKDDHKLQNVVNEISKAGLSICGIQELRRLNTGSALIESSYENNENKYEVYWSGTATKRIHGVGVAIKVDKKIELIEVIPVNERIIVVDLNIAGCDLRVINCYAPTEDHSDHMKDYFYRTLSKNFNVPKPRKIICLGDFNASSSALWYNSSLREDTIIDNLEINNNGERLHQFFHQQHLSVLNSWFNHKKCRRITWHSPDGKTKKVYDLIMCCSWLRQYTHNCRVYNSFDFDSDHRLVIASLKTPCNKVTRYVKQNKKQTKKLDLSALKNRDVETAFVDSAIEKLQSINLDQDNSSLNKDLLDAINTAASENIPNREKVPLNQPWRDDEKLNELFALKAKLITENADRKLIISVRKKIRLRARYLKNEHFKNEAEKINQLAIHRELERLFHRAKSQETTLRSTSHKCSVDKILNHFRNHFNPQDPSSTRTPTEFHEDLPDFIKDLQSITESVIINDNPPTIDEIQKQLNQLKVNKASNDIDPELLKRCCHPIMLQVIHRMTTNLWNTLDITEKWGNSKLKTLWKGKGSKNDPKKYRGLSIGSTVCKLIINIILERLRPWYEAQISGEQNGFRKNRGTTDGIFTVKRAHQITHKKKQPLFLLFVDLSAAFDHIPREWLFESIRLRFPPQNTIRMFDILERMYKNTSLTYDEANTTFKTSSGVRQGGPESPFLFNLYLDFVMRVFLSRCSTINDIKFFKHKYRINPRSVTREERLRMRNQNISGNGEASLPWCGYADDIILFLLDINGLKLSTELLDEIFSTFGLSINELKTETMILNHPEQEYPKSLFSLRNTEIKNVDSFKYLGAYLHYQEPNTGDMELNYRIQSASAKFAQMSNLLQNFRIRLSTRVMFFNSFIRSRLVYACQNWNLTQLQYQRLDVAYRTFLRRMIRNGFKCMNESENDYRLYISNERLHEICSTNDVSYFIHQQQKKYAGHVIRMQNSNCIKQLMFNNDRYTRRGRSVDALLDQVVKRNNTTIDAFCNDAMMKYKESV